MDSKALGLECTLCLDVFTEPKMLSCLHSFCSNCLTLYVSRNHENQTLNCPICRTEWDNVKNPIEKLPIDSVLNAELNHWNELLDIKEKNFCGCREEGEERLEAIVYCIECEEHFCEECQKAHNRLAKNKKHSMGPIEEISKTSKKPSSSCLNHPDKELQLYCESKSCEYPICPSCMIDHKGHHVVPIDHVLEGIKNNLMDLMKKIQPRKEEIKGGIEKCKKTMEDLEMNAILTVSKVEEFFKQIREELGKKEQELIEEIEFIEKSKKKNLDIQRKDLEFGVESMTGTYETINKAIQNPKYSIQLLSMKKMYIERLNTLDQYPWPIIPTQKPSIDFDLSVKNRNLISETIPKLCQINTSQLSGEHCEIILTSPTLKTNEKETCSFEIIAKTKQGIALTSGGNADNFKIRVAGDSQTSIKDLNNGKYLCSIKIKKRGKYKISVYCDSNEIKNSPFVIEVTQNVNQRDYGTINEPKYQFGNNGSGDGQFNFPRWIALDPQENLYITDLFNSRVQILDPKGNFISSFGSRGRGNGEFNQPAGVAICQQKIFVADQGNHRIQIFEPNGEFLETFGVNGSKAGQLNEPNGIGISIEKNLLVCDSKNNRIQIFDLDGNFISTFGSKGSEEGQFKEPVGIAINSIGNIYVYEKNQLRIQVFDSNGKFISQFGSKGTGPGQFKCIKGISIDISDNLLVCDYDSGNRRIQVFDSDNTFVSSFQIGDISPFDFIISLKTQRIYVSDHEKHKIFVF